MVMYELLELEKHDRKNAKRLGLFEDHSDASQVAEKAADPHRSGVTDYGHKRKWVWIIEKGYKHIYACVNDEKPPGYVIEPVPVVPKGQV